MIMSLNGKIQLIDKLEEADKEVDSFIRKMKMKFGINVIVASDEFRHYSNPIKLADIVEVTNKCLKKELGDKMPKEGIKYKQGKRPLVTYRQVYMYIARKCGFPLQRIASELSYSKTSGHCNVIHADSLITNLLSQRDYMVTKIYMEVYNELKKKYRNA